MGQYQHIGAGNAPFCKAAGCEACVAPLFSACDCLLTISTEANLSIYLSIYEINCCELLSFLLVSLLGHLRSTVLFKAEKNICEAQ